MFIFNRRKLAWAFFILLCGFLAMQPEYNQTRPLSSMLDNTVPLLNFKTVFLSIIIEALPFLMLGVFVSAVLNNFVSEEVLGRFIPKNKVLSILMACFLGVVFPICECGIIPVARRLANKGVPLHSVVSFILAAPIINPVVASSTAIAFTADHRMVWLRLSFAFIVAFLTGLLFSCLLRGDELRRENNAVPHGCCCEHHHIEDSQGFCTKVFNTFKDASSEFFEMGKYLMIGAFLAATVQTLVARDMLTGIGHHPTSSIIVMMIFAFGVSVCSSADAFIAASFAGSFTGGSLLAFMVFGPMLDIKNTLMLLSSFKLRLVLLLTVVITVLVSIGAYLINTWV